MTRPAPSAIRPAGERSPAAARGHPSPSPGRPGGRPAPGATIQNTSQTVETLSGGQRQAVAVARAASFATKLVVLDEPTAALGVEESGEVLRTISELRDPGLPVVRISHDVPHVLEVADRIHIQRLGRRATVSRRGRTPCPRPSRS